jgi:hypothetical protein
MNAFSDDDDDAAAAELSNSERGSQSASASTNSGKNSASTKQYTLQKHAYTTQCTDNDVLLGRGYAPTLHEGNVRFRTHVATRKDEYVNSKNRNNKSKIAREVAEWLFRNDGKFIKKLELDEILEHGLIAPDEYQRIISSLQSAECNDLTIPSFYELADDETIMDKAKQALRQMEKVPRPSTRTNAKSIQSTSQGSVNEASVSVVSSYQKGFSPSSHTSTLTSSHINPPDLVDLNLPQQSIPQGVRASVNYPSSIRSPCEPTRSSSAPKESLMHYSSDVATVFQDPKIHQILSELSSLRKGDGSNRTGTAAYSDEANPFSGPEGHAILQKLSEVASYGNTSSTVLSSSNSQPNSAPIDIHPSLQNFHHFSSLPDSVTAQDTQGQHSMDSNSNRSMEQQNIMQIEQQISQLVQYFPNASQDEILCLLQSVRKDGQHELFLDTPLDSGLPSTISPLQQQSDMYQDYQYQQTSLPSSNHLIDRADYGQIRNLDTQQIRVSNADDVTQAYTSLLLQQQQHLDSGHQSNTSGVGNIPLPQQNQVHINHQQQLDQSGNEFLFQQQIENTNAMPPIYNQHEVRISNQRMFQEQETKALPPLHESLNESESDLTSQIGDDWTDGIPSERSLLRKQQYSTDDSMLAYVNSDLLQRISETSNNTGQEYSQKPLSSMSPGLFNTRRGSMGTSSIRGSLRSARRASNASMRSSRTSTYSGMSFQENSISDLGPQYQFSGMDDLMDSFSMMSTDGFSTTNLNGSLQRDPLRTSIANETMGTIENLGNLGDTSFRTLETNIFLTLEPDTTDEPPMRLSMLGMEELVDVPTDTTTTTGSAGNSNAHTSNLDVAVGESRSEFIQ